MRRSLTFLAASAAASALIAVPGVAMADADAYVDGFSSAKNGTGTANAVTEGDRDGNQHVKATATGGTKFAIPSLKLLPTTSTTSARGNSYISDGVDGAVGVAGHDYNVRITFANVDLERSTTGSGKAAASVFAQVAAGSDGAGHTVVAGSDRRQVAADGTIVLDFDVHVTQDSGIGVQAGIDVTAEAKGPGNSGNAELTATVSDVQVTDLG